jgi:hypothetical protein
MKSWFEGKTVAVVGNAQSLFNSSYGEMIDSHDVVVRLNKGILIQDRVAQGVQTDVFAFSSYNVMGFLIKDHFVKAKFMHMSDKGRVPVRSNVFYYPLDLRCSLCERLGYSIDGPPRPSVGVMMLDYIRFQNPSSVSVYGFDWKETPTFYEPSKRREDEPHNYDQERKYCLETLSAENFSFYCPGSVPNA